MNFLRFQRQIIGAALFLSVGTGWGYARATMPSAPIVVALESVGTVAVDTELTVTLTATPLIDAPTLSMQISVPDGVEVVGGETTWAGPTRAHESRVLTVTVRPRTAAPAVIQGAARIEFPDGTVLGDTRALTLALGDRSKPAAGISPPKKTTTGESVIEFRDVP